MNAATPETIRKAFHAWRSVAVVYTDKALGEIDLEVAQALAALDALVAENARYKEIAEAAEAVMAGVDHARFGRGTRGANEEFDRLQRRLREALAGSGGDTTNG